MALETHLERTQEMVRLLKKKDLAKVVTLRLRRSALGADVLHEMHKLSPSHMLFAPIYVECADCAKARPHLNLTVRPHLNLTVRPHLNLTVRRASCDQHLCVRKGSAQVSL